MIFAFTSSLRIPENAVGDRGHQLPQNRQFCLLAQIVPLVRTDLMQDKLLISFLDIDMST